MVENTKTFSRSYRYKDRGMVEYILTENMDSGEHGLSLNYSDDEKEFTWDYTWKCDNKTAIEHINEMTYEGLKEVMVQSLNRGLYGHKGEYILLKDAIIIFVSHKDYIAQDSACLLEKE